MISKCTTGLGMVALLPLILSRVRPISGFPDRLYAAKICWRLTLADSSRPGVRSRITPFSDNEQPREEVFPALRVSGATIGRESGVPEPYNGARAVGDEG